MIMGKECYLFFAFVLEKDMELCNFTMAYHPYALVVINLNKRKIIYVI